MLPPWVYLIAALAVFAAGAEVGHRVTSNAWKAAQLDIENAAVAKYKAEADKQNAAAAQLETKEEHAHVVYKTITKTVDRIVERPVYGAQCFDTDGLRAANNALAGPRANSGGPDAAVSGPDAAGRRERGGSAAQAR